MSELVKAIILTALREELSIRFKFLEKGFSIKDKIPYDQLKIEDIHRDVFLEYSRVTIIGKIT